MHVVVVTAILMLATLFCRTGECSVKAVFTPQANETAADIAQAGSQVTPLDYWQQGEYGSFLTEIPRFTFNLVSAEFRSLKASAKVLPSVGESQFPESDLYNTITVPVFKMSQPVNAYQIELIGQIYDRDMEAFSNMPRYDNLSHYYGSGVHSSNDKEFALGIGASYMLDKNVVVQTLFSSAPIPNHGGNNMTIGVNVGF